MAKTWSISPHHDGDKIPIEMHQQILRQVEDFEKTRSWYPKFHINVRFKNQFCYLDSIGKDNDVSPLCRLRYFKNYGWSMAFYMWSTERYQPCVFSGGDFGTIENAIKACEFCYLN